MLSKRKTNNILVFTFPHLGHINSIIPFISELCDSGNYVSLLVLEKYATYFRNIDCNLLFYDEEVEKFAVQNSDIELYYFLDDAEYLYNIFCEYYNAYERIAVRLEVELNICQWSMIYVDTFSIWGNIFAVKNHYTFIALESFFYENKKIHNCLLEHYFCEIKKYNEREVCSKLMRSDMQFLVAQRKIMRHLGFTREEINNVYCPQKTIVMIDRQLQPYSEYCDKNVIFWGNSVSIDKSPIRNKMGDIKEKIVLVTLGRERGKQHIDKIQSIVEIFRPLSNYKVTITSLEANNIYTYGCEHISIFPYVNQQDILKIADIMITHGGVTGVKEALHFGVPMILLPDSVQQFAISKRVEELGKGKIIELDKLAEVLMQIKVY